MIFKYINPLPRGAKVPVFAKVPRAKRGAVSEKGHEAGTKCMRLCLFLQNKKKKEVILPDTSADTPERNLLSSKAACPRKPPPQ